MLGVLLLAIVPASQARNNKACGSQSRAGAGWYHVHAHNVSCREARHVARHFWHTSDKHFEGWTCHSHRTGIESNRAKCTRQAPHRFQRVKFVFGA